MQKRKLEISDVHESNQNLEFIISLFEGEKGEKLKKEFEKHRKKIEEYLLIDKDALALRVKG